MSQLGEQIIGGLILLIVGGFLGRFLEKKVKLISYFGAIGVHHIKDAKADDAIKVINTHSIVVGNRGREAATNVRIRHAVFPGNYHIVPAIDHQVVTISDTVTEIIFEKLIPGKFLNISYLYFPPVYVDDIHVGIECDQGAAKQINMLFTKQLSKPVRIGAIVWLSIGTICAIAWIVYWMSK